MICVISMIISSILDDNGCVRDRISRFGGPNARLSAARRAGPDLGITLLEQGILPQALYVADLCRCWALSWSFGGENASPPGVAERYVPAWTPRCRFRRASGRGSCREVQRSLADRGPRACATAYSGFGSNPETQITSIRGSIVSPGVEERDRCATTTSALSTSRATSAVA